MSEPEETPETEAASRRGMDPELRVLNGIIRELETLDEDCRARAVSFLMSRYASKA